MPLKDSKCSFGRNCALQLQYEKISLPHRIKDAIQPTQKPFRYGYFVTDQPHFECMTPLHHSMLLTATGSTSL